MIYLKKQHYEEIVNHSIKELPNEACRLIAGEIDGNHKYVKSIYLLTNLDKSPEHFSMDPKEQFSAIKDIRRNNLVLIGNFHSHPSSPARPSEEDKRLAYDPEASYFILSLSDKDNIVLKSFKISRNTVEEEEIKIYEEEI